ncbi:MAG: gliding motility lipoprotein GldH [Phaeodactylibacter sp.]|uniref:gliding motility lipoprotein GldH n=1 Tax=Phaeodactylibacter sp. TaxID=1940289 RepID=UPI0032F08E51
MSLLLGSLFALSSCGPDMIYDATREIPDTGWAYDDPLAFSFEVQDTNKVYNLWLEVEHAADYKTQNLYTKILTAFPDGHRMEETVSLELANKAGVWYGKCDGKDCVLRVPLQSDTYFNQLGSYELGIEQFMRQDSIRGVRALRFMVEDTGRAR